LYWSKPIANGESNAISSLGAPRLQEAEQTGPYSGAHGRGYLTNACNDEDKAEGPRGATESVIVDQGAEVQVAVASLLAWCMRGWGAT